MSDSMTSQYTDQQIDDWASIFGACPTYWSWWVRIEHLDGGDWNRPSKVRLVIEDPYADPHTEGVVEDRTFEPGQIFEALAKATKKYPHLFRRQHGELDLDASSADVVLQVAIFGEAVYG